MEECVECAREFGERLAAEIGVPVFLYGEASAKGDHRVTVPQIRAGEYESLPEKVVRTPDTRYSVVISLSWLT